MSDERLGLPSASKASRWLGCPGSVQAEAQYPDEQSVAGIDGTRRHDLLAGLPVDATDEDYEICDALREIEHAVLDRWVEAHKVSAIICTRESRMKLRDQKKRVIATGKPDVVYLGQSGDKTYALILDYKTGQGVVSSQENAQLSTLAVMAKQELEADVVSCAIIQIGNPALIETLEALDLRVWEQRLWIAIERANEPNSRRIAGEWCLYCKAAAGCSEAHSATKALAETSSQVLDISKLPELLQACTQAEGVIDAVRAKARDLLKAGVEIPGWILRDEARRSITSDSDALERVVQGAGEKVASECVDFSIARLEKALAKEKKVTKKEAKAMADAMLSGLVEKRSFTKLVRVK